MTTTPCRALKPLSSNVSTHSTHTTTMHKLYIMAIFDNDECLVKPLAEKLCICLWSYRWGTLLAFRYPKLLTHTVYIYVLIVHVFQRL